MNPDFGEQVADEPRLRLGEALETILDFDTWRQGDDLTETYERIEREVADSLAQEERVGEQIRQRLLPLIRNRVGAPPGAGLYAATIEQLRWVHHNLLFNGATVAADGTVAHHDTMLMTIAQIGVCTVSYIGETGEFRKQLFRRDLRVEGYDPIEEAMELLQERQNRPALGYEDEKDEISRLMRRSLMSYAEHGLLLRHSPKWLMGHGSPVPREMLAGGLQTMLINSLDILSEMVLTHQKFVYVPSAPRELLVATLGNTLAPLQFLIVDTLYEQIERWVSQTTGYSREMGRRVREFVEEVGPKIVRGVYRASAGGPAQVFYAHVDHAQEAALIALADSVLQEHRGFPMLLDLADTLCRVSFEPQTFRTVVQQSYAKAGQPFRYLMERETRR